MGQHMLASALRVNIVDKRKLLSSDDDSTIHIQGASVFTANAGGTTTTLVGANAAPAAGTNVMRVGDRFKLFTSSGNLKEEKIFKVTVIAVAASTTVTFSPAASVVTASGDVAKLVTLDSFEDIASLDDRLKALDSTNFTDTRLLNMTVNDKVYAVRLLDDATGV